MASLISQAMKQIAEEKNISYESVLSTVESALAAAYRKDFGNKNQNIQVEFDPEKYDGQTAGIRVFDVKSVVADMELPEGYMEKFEAAHVPKKRDDQPFSREIKPTETVKVEGAEDEFVFNPKLMIMLSDARDLKPDAAVGQDIRVELSVPTAFGRMAAQTAKQVVLQKIREAERNVIFTDFKAKEGELMNVTVQRRDGRMVLIDLGRATGVLLPEDQVETERYYPGTRLKVYLREVLMTSKGPEIRLSRTSPQLLATLFAQEIPEIGSGVVEIKTVAREPGSRSKVAVHSTDDAVDPIGSCIGQRGTRIQTIIRELGGEKVDIIQWSGDDVAFITGALSPAKVLDIKLQPDDRLAVVHVAADQLSLAIGKGGQNVRLAAKLTGWRLTIAEPGGKVVDLEQAEAGAIPSTEEVATSVSTESPEAAEPSAESAPNQSPVEASEKA